MGPWLRARTGRRPAPGRPAERPQSPAPARRAARTYVAQIDPPIKRGYANRASWLSRQPMKQKSPVFAGFPRFLYGLAWPLEVGRMREAWSSPDQRGLISLIVPIRFGQPYGDGKAQAGPFRFLFTSLSNPGKNSWKSRCRVSRHAATGVRHGNLQPILRRPPPSGPRSCLPG